MWQSYFSIGSITIYFYGIFISLGVLLGYLFARKRSPKFNTPKEFLDTLLLILLPSCILGARIYHILSWFSYYKIFPKEIFFLWQGGFGVYGAIIAGLIVIFFFAKFKKIPFLSVLDLLSPSVLIAQAIGRIGNFFNFEGFGPPTNLPWKIYIPPDKRPINFLDQSYFHPTFFYESILCLISLLVILYLESRIKHSPGFVVGLYLAFYGLIRFFLEFLRFDTWVVSGIKIAQVLSLIFIFVALVLIKKMIK